MKFRETIEREVVYEVPEDFIATDLEAIEEMLEDTLPESSIEHGDKIEIHSVEEVVTFDVSFSASWVRNAAGGWFLRMGGFTALVDPVGDSGRFEWHVVNSVGKAVQHGGADYESEARTVAADILKNAIEENA
ncbi:hypothetical protein GS882_07665 [Rhodococcus hoagii]|uniref:Uncharacterized protein n=1 Tax=Rhodococcus hoagii TaxID=43767 RepID=A0A9Q5EVS4_RHOHA|nr:hypothetical protein [Prescottella equi]NKT78003.1 hypothetical protein [Prescottella equi]